MASISEQLASRVELARDHAKDFREAPRSR
jgi:hypothetical protein